MKLLIRLLILSILFLGTANTTEVFCQKKSRSMREIDRRANRSERLLKRDQSRKVIKAEKKAAKVKRKQAIAYERAKKKDKDHRMSIQSERTKEMMKETEKKAEQARKARKEPFIKRLFKRKPR